MREIILPYTPHAGQRDIHATKARFKVLTCGRRFGKDRATLNEAARMAFRMAAEPRPRSLIPRVHVWTVAPTYPMLRQTWNELKAMWVPTGLIKRKDEAELTLEFHNGIFWELKSAEKPESLVGVGLDILTVTEAARVKRDAWYDNLRPALSSPKRGPSMRGKGIAIFNSTPKGRNWYYDIHRLGQEYLIDKNGERIPNPDYDPEWRSWQKPTMDNPLINPEEIEAARRQLPQQVFEQEYLARFLDDVAGVFVNVYSCATGTLQEPEDGAQYAVGVDLAYLQDYTVIVVMNVNTSDVVYVDRFQSPLWTEQEPRIVDAILRYNAETICIDRTGVGQTAPEMLRGRLAELGKSPRIDGVFLDQNTKERLIQQLQMAFQTKSITIPAECDYMIDELIAYEYQYTKSGRFRYGAPHGEHDDCVVALALAVEAARIGKYNYDQDEL